MWCAQRSVPMTNAMLIEDRKERWNEIQREVRQNQVVLFGTGENNVSVAEMRDRERKLAEVVEILNETAEESVHMTAEQESALLAFFVELPFFSALEKTQQHAVVNCLQLTTLHEAEGLVKKGQEGLECHIMLRGLLFEPRTDAEDEHDSEDEDSDYEPPARYGPMDLIGEDAIKGEHAKDRIWGTSLVAQELCLFATLRRGDFLRCTGDLLGVVRRRLEKPKERRSAADVALIRDLLRPGPFFKGLFFKVLQREACRRMTLTTVPVGGELLLKEACNHHTVGEQEHVDPSGLEHGHFHIILKGEAEVAEGEVNAEFDLTHGIRNIGVKDVVEGTVIKAQGEEFGLECATLSESDRDYVARGLLDESLKALKLMPDLRDVDHVDLLAELLDDTTFIRGLGSSMMRRQCIKRLSFKSVRAGDVFFHEGFIGEQMGIVIRGAISLDAFGETGLKKHDRIVGVGQSIGEQSLGARRPNDMVRTRTATAEVDTSLAVLARCDYQCVCKIDEMQSIVAKFWQLICPAGKEFVRFEQYAKLQTRLAKTIQPFFSKKEADTVAREDWDRDVALLGDVKTNTLNQEQFSESMFQLVDEWCEDFPSSSLYVDFLEVL